MDNRPEEFTQDNVMEMSASEPVPDSKEEYVGEAMPQSKLTLDNLAKGLIIHDCFLLLL